MEALKLKAMARLKNKKARKSRAKELKKASKSKNQEIPIVVEKKISSPVIPQL
jgi:hypothetical protein